MLQFKDSEDLKEISQLAGFPHLAEDVDLQFSVVWLVMKSLVGMLQFSLDN